MSKPDEVPQEIAMEVHVDGQSLKLLPEGVTALKRMGYAAPDALVTELIKQFGTVAAQALISYIVARSKRVGFSFSPGDVSVDAAKHLLAGLLRSYKEKLGDKAKSWTEEGLKELADYLETPDAPAIFG